MRLALITALTVSVSVAGTLVADEVVRPLGILLQSAQLSAKVAGAHAIGFTGTITGEAGQGQLVLDPNACTLDEFGDPATCTTIAQRVVDVTLQRLRTADPAGRGRRLYGVDGKGLEGRFRLVAPHGPRGGGYRLIHQQGETRVVVPLEFVVASRESAPAERPEAAPRKPRAETCTPLPITVDETTAKATLGKGKKRLLTLVGKKPHMNTKVRFTAVTYIRQPEYWQIDVQECSEGDIRLPAIADYRATHDVSSTLGTKGIVLTFADGKTIKLDVQGGGGDTE